MKSWYCQFAVSKMPSGVGPKSEDTKDTKNSPGNGENANEAGL